jgi:lipid-A-disaccharide synthase
MKYYVIAGEPSGDLHGSNLIKELRELDHNAEFRCWGGDLMQKQGGMIIKHIRDLAFMGFIEVVMNLRTILINIEFCKSDIASYKPDAIILIDYPGFNLRIAQYAKSIGIKVYYYISPQIWAWKEKRVEIIKANVDRLFAILPFEKAFYKKHNYNVDFVGHPLMDAIGNEGDISCSFDEFVEKNGLSGKPIIALLPGSRKQEITAILPIMVSVKDDFPNYQFVIAASSALPLSFFQPFVRSSATVKIVYKQTYQLLQHASAALVTSGTATLETALFNVPEVVCYKGSFISYEIAKRLIKVEYISLVNLIMDREIVKELIQNKFTLKSLSKELASLLHDNHRRTQLLNEYKKLRQVLGGPGASKRTAEIIVSDLKKTRW